MSLLKMGFLFALYAQAEGEGPVDLPELDLPPVRERGLASWYGDGSWHGGVTANGEAFEPERAQTCAHRTLPFDTVALIERRSSGERAWCRINDRGPYGVVGDDGVWHVNVGRSEETRYRGILDMSIATARALTGEPSGLQSILLRYWSTRRTPRFDLAIWPHN